MPSMNHKMVNLVNGDSIRMSQSAHMFIAVPEIGATNDHVSTRSEVNKSKSVFIGLFVQTKLANNRPVYAFSPHFGVKIPENNFHVMCRAVVVCIPESRAKSVFGLFTLFIY